MFKPKILYNQDTLQSSILNLKYLYLKYISVSQPQEYIISKA